MDAVELYLLGDRLMAIAGEALPPDSALRRLSPGERLVFTDVLGHPGTSAVSAAVRTGLPPEHVAASMARLAGDGVVQMAGDPADPAQAHARPAIRERPRDAGGPVNDRLAEALRDAGPGEADRLVGVLEDLARRLAASVGARRPEDFNEMYSGTPPWDIGRPQRAFAELADRGAITGHVLDVGCGTGEHALMAAGLGLPALGVDAAPAAIEIARRKAADRGAEVRFAVHDALRLAELGEKFGTVIDSGLFHVFGDDDRARYVDSLRAVIPSGGRYFMLCFSDRQPPGYGPRRITEDEIRTSFADGWRVDAIDAVTLEVTIDPEGVRAWRAEITRA